MKSDTSVRATWLTLALFITLMLIGAPTYAGSLKQAEQAYKNGDYAKAISIWRPLANQGNPEAQNLLGEMYRKGRGVKRDFKKAEFWYSKSANKGYAEAQYNLASLYRTGKGIKKDSKKAALWFKKAAEQNHIKAQYNIAVMYENGWGVDKNLEQAALWYKKSAAQGNKSAQKKLARLGSKGLSSVEKSSLSNDDKLIHAASDGRLDAVQRLLKAGANPNASDAHGRTPLMEAAEKNHAEVVD
ncbi:ankyrin repeat domain-containing protein, partial [Kaarinaea lacus]